MREFFIEWFEKLVAVIVVLLLVGTVIGAIGAATQPGAGIVMAILVLIGGGLYTIFLGGVMSLVLGIYHNPRRTAEAVEKQAAR